MELTKEFFEQTVKGLATKTDISDIRTDLGNVKVDISDIRTDMEKLATKADLESVRTDLGNVKAGLEMKIDGLKTELVARIDESQTQLAQMVKRGFDDINTRLDDSRKRIVVLEEQVHEVRQELNLA